MTPNSSSTKPFVEADDDAGDVARYGTPRLVAHIRDRYHDTHRRELADAIALAERVECENRADDACPHGLADHLAAMLDHLETHQHKEEVVIFPALMRGAGAVMTKPLSKMASDHAEFETDLRELRRLTSGHEPPSHAGTHWRLLYALCRKVDADLREHIRLEDEILFPRFFAFAPTQRGPGPHPLEDGHGAVEPRVSHQGQ